jgi:uncharacterized membrane protein
MGAGAQTAQPTMSGKYFGLQLHHILWMLLVIVMFLLVSGYNMGKDAAQRDNRMEQAEKAACAANSDDCKR